MTGTFVKIINNLVNTHSTLFLVSLIIFPKYPVIMRFCKRYPTIVIIIVFRESTHHVTYTVFF